MEANEIQDLLERWTAGGLTEAESNRLLSLLEDDNQKDMVITILQQGMLGESAAGVFDEGRYMPLLRAVLDADREGADGSGIVRPMGGRKLLMGWRAAAAVLIVVLGTVLAVVVGRHRKGDAGGAGVAPVALADAMPGSNKAVLRMANGSSILLDSAHNGTLAELGDVRVVKTDSGKIRYEAGAGGSTDGGLADNLLTTPRGGQYQLTLPDGTQVWLNAASSIRYPSVFAGGERKVTVTGEVYFEVAKDRSKPFMVQVNDMQVAVLGTHFNINAYPDESIVRTTLLEGSVRVEHLGKAVVIRPGQEAQVRQGPIRVVDEIDTVQVMAWKNGLFQFRNADLRTVMRQLARWYDLEVVYEGNVPDDRFDGKIPRDAMAAQVLTVLQKNQIHFRIEGKKLIVMP